MDISNHKYITLNVIKQDVIHSQCVKSNRPRVKFSPIKKYTLPIFLNRAHIVHGLKFNYKLICPEHINGKDSHVPVICTMCNYIWVKSRRDSTWDELSSS